VNDPDSFYTLSVGGGFASQFQFINGGANGGQLVLKPGQSIAAAGPITIPVIATDNATGQTLTQNLTFDVVPGTAGAYTIAGLTAAGGLPTVNYTEQQGPVVISTGLAIGGGPAGGSLSSASVAITGFNAAQQERLGIAGQAGNSGTITGTALTWTYDPATGILTFAGVGSAADYQSAFRQVFYSNASDAPLATRSLTYTVGSGATAGQGFATIGITAVNDLPTAINLAANKVPTGQAGGVVGAITVVDPDGPSGAGAYTFTVSGGGGLFEIVNGQLKLKAGQAITPGQIIDSISIDLIDGGAANGGAFSQAFNLTTGVGPASDIFWRNSANSQAVFWDVINAREVIGGQILTYGQGIGDGRVGQATAFGPTFRTVGLRDMNGDGINDLILTNGPSIIVATIGEVNGRPTTIEAQASPTFNSPLFGALNGQVAAPDASSQLIGLEDMNGDGQPDYVFYNSALNSVVIWTTNKLNQVTNGLVVAGAPPVPGKFEAIGDFDGDGDKDILWRNGSNVFLWTMNGGQFVSQTALTQLSDPSFVLAGVGDFNKDGRQDVVWRSQALNATVLWLFGTNTQILNPPAVVLPPTSTAGGVWQIGAVADLDGDGTSDILWRNNTQDLAVFWRIVNGQLDAPNSGPILNRLPNNTGGPIATRDPAWNISGANGVAQSTAVAPTP
jgi:FG-GAP-like repeat